MSSANSNACARLSRRARLAVAVCFIAAVTLAAGCGGSVDARLAEIQALQDAGDFSSSVEPLRGILASDPDHAQANYLLGVALVQTRQPSLAIWPLRKAAQDSEFAVPSGLLLASTLSQMQGYEEAVKAADSVLRVDADSVYALQIRANSHIGMGKHDDALLDAERVLELQPESTQAFALKAMALTKLDRIDDALATIETLNEKAKAGEDPGVAMQACVALATFHREQKMDAAESVILDCNTRFPGEPTVLREADAYYDSLEQPDKATALWQQAVEQAPDNYGLRSMLAERLANQGNGAEAETVLVEAAELFEDARAWDQLARFYQGQNEYEKALGATEKALERAEGLPTDDLLFRRADLLVLLDRAPEADGVVEQLEQPVYKDLIRARVLIAEERHAEALDLLEAAITRWPNNAGARYLAGMTAEEVGDTRKALAHYREATRADEHETDAALSIARIQLSRGEFDDAIVMALRHVTNRPVHHNEARIISARAQTAQGRYDASRSLLNNVIKSSPESPDGYVELAGVERAAGDRAAAARIVEESGLELTDPANLNALRSLAEDYLVLGRTDTVRQLVAAAIAQSPDEPALRDIEGRVLFSAGNPTGARKAFEAAGDYAPALTALAQMEVDAGNVDAALALLDRARKADPSDAPAAYLIAQLRLAGGDTAGAEALLREVVVLEPSHAGAANDLAWILAEQQKDLELALSLARRAARLDSQTDRPGHTGLGPVPQRRRRRGGRHLQAGARGGRRRGLGPVPSGPGARCARTRRRRAGGVPRRAGVRECLPRIGSRSHRDRAPRGGPMIQLARGWRVAVALCLATAVLACQSDEERIAGHLAEAEALIEAREYKDALTELRTALKLQPDSADINFQIALVLERMQRFEDAIFFFGETHRIDPSRTDAAVREAGMLVFDDPVRMNELIDEVLEKDSDNALAYVVKSRRAVIDGDLETALRNALTAAELDPGHANAHLQVAKVHQARIRERQLAEEEIDDSIYEQGLAALARAEAARGDETITLELLEKAKILATWPGHEREAAEAYKAAIDEAFEAEIPAMAEDALRRGHVLAQSLGDVELRRWLLERHIELRPANMRLWLGLARAEHDAGGSADDVMERLLKEQPENPEAHVRYGQYLASLGRIDEARSHLLASAENEALDPALMLSALADIVGGAGLKDEQTQLVDQLIRDYPDHPRAVMQSATRDIAAERYEEAAASLRSLVGRSERADAYLLLANVERALGDRKAALAAVDRTVELTRNRFPLQAMRLRSQLHAELGNCHDALRGFTAVKRSGNDLQTPDRILQGSCLYDLGRPRMGKQIFEKLLKDTGPVPWLVAEYARREGERDPERIRELLEQSNAKFPGNARVLAHLGRLDFAAGNAGLALARLDKAVESGKATPTILLERARVLAATGDLDGALRDALRAFEAAPDLEGASSLLLSIYAAQDRTDEAIASFEEAYAVGALQPSSRVLLGRLHMLQDNHERATELLDEVVRENDSLPGAKNDLAYLLALQSKDLDRALELAQAAQRSLPRTASVADTLGFVYLQRELYEPALEQFRYAVSLADERGSGQPLFHYHVGQALEKLGRTDEAATEFERALALDSEFEDAAAALRAVRPDGEPPPASG